MNAAPPTSMERVLTTLSGQEADRIPFLLPVTIGAARELGLSIKEYLSRPENIVEGQLRKLAKFRDDFVVSLFYGAVDAEAWGVEVIYFDDGPPNSGEPILRDPERIRGLEPPSVKETEALLKVLRATEMLREKLGESVPVVGVVISPFSLPVMQMGFDRYIELIYERPDLFERLMKVNEVFCAEWANAQVEAGATAIVYFDPVSSSTILPEDVYLKTGFQVARRMVPRINASLGLHMASGRCLPILQHIIRLGMPILGVSAEEDLALLKRKAEGRITLIGNLNGIAMRHWSPDRAEAEVRGAIAKAGPGGGFILSDNQGEIPWQVSEETLMAISEAAHKWGRYPLGWVEDYGGE